MLFPAIHERGTLVRVQNDDDPPYEARVIDVKDKVTDLGRKVEAYLVADSRCPENVMETLSVQRIVRVTMPGRDSFRAIIGGTAHGTINGYFTYRLDDNLGFDVNRLDPDIVVDPAWVTPL